MAREIIINHTSYETRVAVIENGMLAGLYHERDKERGIVGNVYKGKVLKVLPGMEAAFVDIGEERAAFLYIDDVLPDTVLFEEIEEKSSSHRNKDTKVPIEELLKENQEILVQVAKGPIGTKGARITSHISLPGRNLVHMPTVNTVGVSRQITDEAERQRLKDLVERLRPERTGFILRTVAEGNTEEDLRYDINFLASLWDGIVSKYQSMPAPALLHRDLNVIFRSIRDLLSSNVRRLIIDDEDQHDAIKSFLKSYLPRYAYILEHFSRSVPIFDHYSVETEIDRALGQKVWLRSGGYLIIDQTEALTTIDVNTGRFVGEESHEQTILKTNLEAAKELVYQIRLRNIGGIIIIDFIDMERPQNRNTVYETLKDELRYDKARSKILQISEMGLVEMTRKRDRESLVRYLCDSCPYCEGKGRIKSPSTVSFEMFRELHRICGKGEVGGSIVVYLHPDVHHYLIDEVDTLQSLEKGLQQKIILKPANRLHREQFEIYQY